MPPRQCSWCSVLGQDFRFNANYLRMALSVALLLSPMVTLAVYGGLGLVVAASRWLFPVRAVETAAIAARPAVAH